MDNFDRFLRNENMWFKAAVGAAVLVFATVVIGTIVSLATANGAEHRGQSIDVVYKLGLIGAGFITFCTVAWRGLIATQQAEMQRQQIDKLSLQIAATEESNLATLLQKGAELISARDKPGHVAAGIATLQAVIEGTKDKFARHAMDVVADYVQDTFTIGTPNNLCRAALSALEAGANVGRYANRSLEFEANDDESFMQEWTLIQGVKSVSYKGGYAYGLTAKNLTGMPRNRFNEVYIYNAEDISLDKWGQFTRCEFVRCSFSAIRLEFYYQQKTLRHCDLSNTEIDTLTLMPDLRDGDNFFTPGNPPRNPGEFDWSTVLRTSPRSAEDDRIPF